MAHREEAALPDTLNHPQTQGWIRSRVRDGEKPNDVKAAAEYVVGQAEAHLKDCAKNDKDLPLSFFYTLFAFTNFDSLAFEIEEALMPMNSNSTTTIRRQVRKVRRADLVQQDANPTLPTELA
jgi:antirestriction protein ArdC